MAVLAPVVIASRSAERCHEAADRLTLRPGSVNLTEVVLPVDGGWTAH
jgi:hypothetical protein